MPIKVVIADDQPIVIEGIKAVLKKTADDIIVVGEAANGNQVLEIAQKTPADIYVLDIAMPFLNGLEAMARLLHKDKKTKIIILSMHDDRPTVEYALRAGARGYLTKESVTEDIVGALRAVYRGQYYLSPSLSRFAIANMPDASETI
jgi:DNA-binding NarL/FixJ family response regulator